MELQFLVDQLKQGLLDRPVWMTQNNVSYEQLAAALGISVAEAKKRYPVNADAAKTTTTAAPTTTETPVDNLGGKAGGLMALAGGGAAVNPLQSALTSDVQNGYDKLNKQGMANSRQGKQLRQELDYRARMQGYQQNPQVQQPQQAQQYNLGGYSDGGRLLKGPGDGMSDSIPASIGNKQPARLADGEFVVPADVVSHLGNGSTDAGAKQLYSMMDKVRTARTGRKSQGKQINPKKYVPA